MSRSGNFSSSQIFRLMNPGKREMTSSETEALKKAKPKSNARLTHSFDTPDPTMMTYIKEKRREINLNRPINSECGARSLVWGKIMERYVFENKLDTSYSHMNSHPRLVHPKIKRWTGKPDTLRNFQIVGDIKNPYTLTSFCDKVESMVSVEELKNNQKEDYWQLVSGSCLVPCDWAELIVYAPYASELPKIQEFISMFEGDDEIGVFQVKWIYDEIMDFMNSGLEPSFPYLPNDCNYKDLNIFEFEVPKGDKEALTERVKMASKLLIPANH